MIILATTNAGKVREIEKLLSDLPLKIQSLKEHQECLPMPEETGSTFAENALIKARHVWKKTKKTVIADDSGLACDDLNGRPGVYSARYAGPHATDDENNQRLVEEMQEVHDASRKIRYVCALALIDANGKEHVFEETCDGVFTFKPAGDGGFGYDPYFYLPEFKKTMAEISLEEKNLISHRGKALAILKKHIQLKKM